MTVILHDLVCMCFSLDFHPLTNTEHQHFHLSVGNTMITHTGTNYRYTYPQDWFDHAQALCRESVSGCCYWEVEYSASSFLPESDGNPHTQLPWRLAAFSPVKPEAMHPQIPAPQSSGKPGIQGQHWQELAPPHSTDFVRGCGLWLSSNAVLSLTRAHPENQEFGGPVQVGELFSPSTGFKSYWA